MGFWTKKPTDEDANVAPGAAVSASNSPAPSPSVTSATPAILGANDTVKAAAPQIPQPDPSKVRCALGAGTYINGKLSFDTSVQIDGKMKGELFSSRTLIVGSTGLVEADVDVHTLVVYGTVRGKIRVADRLELKAGSLLEGEVYAPTLVMDEGATVNGDIGMGLLKPSEDPKLSFAQGESRKTDKEKSEKRSGGSSSTEKEPARPSPEVRAGV